VGCREGWGEGWGVGRGYTVRVRIRIKVRVRVRVSNLGAHARHEKAGAVAGAEHVALGAYVRFGADADAWPFVGVDLIVVERG
jgi:hypothetical protein